MNDETKDPVAPPPADAAPPAETAAEVAEPVVAKPPEALPVIYNAQGVAPATPPANGTMAALRAASVLVVMFGLGFVMLWSFGIVPNGAGNEDTAMRDLVAKSEHEREAAEARLNMQRKPPPLPYAAPTITVTAGMIGDRRNFPDPPPPLASGSAKPGGKKGPPDEPSTIEAARAAIARGESAKALVILDAHDRDFAQGLMNPDATVLRIEALARTGEDARAKQLAEGFLTDFPHSPLAGRVRGLLDAINRKTATP